MTLARKSGDSGINEVPLKYHIWFNEREDNMQLNSSYLCGLLALLLAGSAAAQTNYPEKPIRVLVGGSAGGQLDTAARLLAATFAQTLGKPAVTENQAGASGSIAVEHVAKAPPDGYILGVVSQAQVAINPYLNKVGYDPVKDFAPVSQLSSAVSILVVNNTVPAKSVKDVIALAKKQPGELTYASAGVGSGNQLASELFKTLAGVDIRGINYKGVVEAMPDLLAGRVTLSFLAVAITTPLARDGKVRALAVTSSKRWPSVPDLPTIAEAGVPGYDFTTWHGLLAPAGTPTAIVTKLNQATVKALTFPDLRAKFADLGLEGLGTSPAEFAAVIKSENVRWAKIIKDTGITAE